MFSPSTEIDEEIVVDEDGNISVSCKTNESLEQLEDEGSNGDKVVNDEDSNDDNHE